MHENDWSVAVEGARRADLDRVRGNLVVGGYGEIALLPFVRGTPAAAERRAARARAWQVRGELGNDMGKLGLFNVR